MSSGESARGAGVRVINTKTVEAYMAKHSQCRASLEAWLAEARAADWKTPGDVKSRYPAASLLPENLVVFDIAGNHYRLLCRIAYKSALIVIQRIGTHAEYDKWRL
jgi:mRNA interferase HigB